MHRLTWGLLGVLILLTGCATTQTQEPAIQRISEEELERIMPKPVPNLTLEEIVQLSKSGVPDDEIIQKIQETHSQYDLTPSQSLDLSKQGVSPKVLDHIHTSREQLLRDSLAEEINKREREKEEEKQRLRRDYQWRSQQMMMHPWGWGVHPFYGRRWGWGMGVGPGWWW